MNIYVGTSAYSIKEWKGKFYPKDLPQKQMLRYYGERFKTVEINNTFYRMPKASVLEAWLSEVAGDFRFAIKAPQQITHFQRLKGSTETVQHLIDTVSVLGPRLGPLFFQLPPNFKKDTARLRDFLAILPKACRIAFEFRHPSWFDDETFGLLRDHSAALCIAEDDNELQVPIVATADWGYLRLRRLDYDDAALRAWANVIWQQSWTEAFIFFKHEDSALGPAFAAKFQTVLEEFRSTNGGGHRKCLQTESG